jgi:hypothetical protein
MEHISQTVGMEHMSLAEVKQVLTTAAEQHQPDPDESEYKTLQRRSSNLGVHDKQAQHLYVNDGRSSSK